MEVTIKGTHEEIAALVLELQERQAVEDEIAENRATYSAWKEDLKRTGQTPADAIARCRALGLTDYADRLGKAILQMEGSDIKTCDLVQELMKREGVEATIAEPHKDVGIPVSGPAIVLVVTD